MRTLISCIEQTDVEGELEIVVVDNDVEATARPVIAAIIKSSSKAILYVKEDRPGISWARNAGVAAARGRYLVFLDDDEVAKPGWLRALHATIQNSGADIAVGPVYPCFSVVDTEVPRYARKLYTRDAHLPNGAKLQWGHIGNCIIRRERCFVDRLPFDPRLGLSGGEDALFLRQASVRGCKLVWCAEAIVWENIPVDKLSSSYLLRRAFRGGQITTFVHFAVRPMEIWRGLRWMTIGLAQVAMYAPVGCVLWISGSQRWLDVIAKAASGLGKLLPHSALHFRSYRLKN
jgi:succinoglycan biosynthesis protein ExoM